MWNLLEEVRASPAKGCKSLLDAHCAQLDVKVQHVGQESLVYLPEKRFNVRIGTE